MSKLLREEATGAFHASNTFTATKPEHLRLCLVTLAPEVHRAIEPVGLHVQVYNQVSTCDKRIRLLSARSSGDVKVILKQSDLQVPVSEVGVRLLDSKSGLAVWPNTMFREGSSRDPEPAPEPEGASSGQRT